jgi:hypothetical protein
MADHPHRLVVYKSSQVIRQRRAISRVRKEASEMPGPETCALFGGLKRLTVLSIIEQQSGARTTIRFSKAVMKSCT